MHNIHKQKHCTNNVLNKSYMLFNHSVEGIKNYKQSVNKNNLHMLLNTVVNFDKFFICICTNKSNSV